MISLFGFVRLQGAPGIWRIQCAQVCWQHGFWGLSRARECSLCTMTGMQQADYGDGDNVLCRSIVHVCITVGAESRRCVVPSEVKGLVAL